MTEGELQAGGASGSPLAAAWELVRPFTLVAPALGILSGAVTAYGAHPRYVHTGGSTAAWVHDLVVGSIAAGLLNGASNVLNQVCDLAIDRINKPARVLPSGRMSRGAAVRLSIGLYAAALGAAATINAPVFLLFALGAAATVVYSVPPMRTKRLGWWANVTIAIPRGVLLKVAGWSITKPVLAPEAWLIGGVFGLFLLGATTSKDFADVAGDAAEGCRTLPVVYGRQRTIALIRPFFTVPFLLLAIGGATGVFTGNRLALVVLGLVCAGWGHHVVHLLADDPSAQLSENHPSWRHMYYLMFALQVGFALAYLLP